MSIIRVQKTDNFVIIDKRALQDKRLSWKAKGILAYLLSMPNDWVFHMEELQTHATDGKASFQSGFKELKECGYVVRQPVKDEKTRKITHWETIVREVPVDVQEKPQTEKPPTGNPVSGNPVSGKPTDWNPIDRENHEVENQPLLRINNTKNDCTKDNLTNVDDDKAQAPENASINNEYVNNMIRNPIFAELMKFYEQNIGVVVPNAVQEAFNDFCEVYGHMDIKLIKRILQNTMMMPNVKHKINYAFKTLRALNAENVHTIEQHDLYERANAHFEQPQTKGAKQHAKRDESTGGQYSPISIRDISL